MVFSSLQQRAQVLTEAQRREREERVKAEKEERMEASNTRKKDMNELEMKRKLNEKPSDLEMVCTHSFCFPVWCQERERERERECVCVCV